MAPSIRIPWNFMHGLVETAGGGTAVLLYVLVSGHRSDDLATPPIALRTVSKKNRLKIVRYLGRNSKLIASLISLIFGRSLPIVFRHLPLAFRRLFLVFRQSPKWFRHLPIAFRSKNASYSPYT